MNDTNVYVLVKNTYCLNERTYDSYGIAAIDQDNSLVTVIKTVSNISSDHSAVKKLIDECNKKNLDIDALDDFIEDYLS